MSHFPPNFLEHLQKCDGFDESSFIKAHEIVPPVSIRINRNKPVLNFSTNEKVAWCESGFYLTERPSFTHDPLFHAGAYYVQEASSMFLDFLLRETTDLFKPLTILDLCAAPGGKSTLIANLISDESLLISNEVIRSRVNVLHENIVKWGNANVIVTNNDPADFSRLHEFFDVIVVDAPCSGSGLFRKDPQAMQEWSEDNVLMCSRRQLRILDDVMPSLKQNGVLIYATCSYSFEEDETIVQELISSGNFELINPAVEIPGIVQNEYGFRFYPDKIKGEGFFISALKKINYQATEKESRQKKLDLINESELEIISGKVKTDRLTYFKIKEVIHAIPSKQFANAEIIFSNLKTISAGIEIGKIMGSDLIPSHHLAMSQLLKDSVTKIELDLQKSIEYLRKNPIRSERDDYGFCIVRYQGVALGWVKLIPGRVNNYYPIEWRIRK